jgi:hypothetical protein
VSCGDIPNLVGIDGVGFGCAEVDASFGFVLKFLSFPFFDVGKGLTAERLKIGEIGLFSRCELIW